MAITERLAEAIAKNLRNGGYPDTTGAEVIAELAKSPQDRSIIGMFAHGMLADNGIADDGSPLDTDE